MSGKDVILNIPVKVKGNSPGVRAGGRLAQPIKRLRLKGDSKSMPDVVEVSIDKLEIGQSVRVRDVSVLNVTILDAPANTVVAVEATRSSMQAEAPAAKAGAKDAKKK